MVEHTIIVRSTTPKIVLTVYYCPDLPIRPASSIYTTINTSLRTIGRRVRREGYNALLANTFTSELEAGVNCVIEIGARGPPNPPPGRSTGPMTVGAAKDILSWMRTWMVLGGRDGTIVFNAYTDGERRIGSGYIRPREDAPAV
ncbi:MAG: hypothetical protein Q9168_008405 [Polycauliona sp. 1 TL-2023]